MNAGGQHISEIGYSSNTRSGHRSSVGSNDGVLHRSYAQIVIKEPNTTEPKKAKRKRITPEQLKELTAVFEKTDTPTHDIREDLSKKLSMTNREVQVWFQNRRAKYNRLRIEQQRQMRTNAAIIYSAGIITRAAVPIAVPVTASGPVSVTMPAAAPPLHPPPAMYSHFQQRPLQLHATIQPHPQLLLSKPLDDTSAPASEHSSSGFPLPGQSMLLGNMSADHTTMKQNLHNNHHSATNNSLLDTSYPTEAASIANVASPVNQQHHYVQEPGLYRFDRYAGIPVPRCQPTPPMVSPVHRQLELPHCPPTAPSLDSNYTPCEEMGLVADARQYSSEGLRRRYSQQHCIDSQQQPNRNGDQRTRVLNGRRNTLSTYQETGTASESCVYDSDDCGSTANDGMQTFMAGSLLLTQHTGAMSARSRYMGDIPASDSRGRFRHSVQRQHSPPSLEPPYSQGNCSKTVTSAIANAVKPANTGSYAVKLPSFQTMLASVEAAGEKPFETFTNAPSGCLETTLSGGYNSLPAHRSNIETHADARLSLERHGRYLPFNVKCSSPHAQCYLESQINDAKRGIDVLATAAISVSSAKSSSSLPHLTPLSEFAHRGTPSHSTQPAHTLPSNYLDQHPTLLKSEGADPDLIVRSRKATPSNSRDNSRRCNWRPW